jgi:[ribosomal protein S18]-alanine N-acetyltransferase
MKVLRLTSLEAGYLPQILPIENEANTSPWSEKAFQNELINPQSNFLVALGDGNVVGYGCYWRCIDEAHITNVAVAPEHRRAGIGRRIMIELLNQARDEGLLCSTLEVRASNEAAIQLYEKLGYKTVARRKGYYPDNREDALVMWLYELDQWKA